MVSSNEQVLDIIRNEQLHIPECASLAFRCNMQFVDGKKLNGRVLDIGAGNRAMTRLLAGAHPDATFYVSEPRQDRAYYEINPLSRWTRSQSPNIPFRDRTFSAVTCFHAFDLMTDVEGFFKETSRVMEQGGSLFFNLLNPYVAGPSVSLQSAMDTTPAPQFAYMDQRLTELGADEFTRYLQRVLCLSAQHGLELTRLSRTGNIEAKKFSSLDPDSAQYERWRQFEATRHDKHPDSLALDEATTAFYFEFTKVPSDKKIDVQPVQEWIDHANGHAPYVGPETNGPAHSLVPLVIKPTMDQAGVLISIG